MLNIIINGNTNIKFLLLYTKMDGDRKKLEILLKHWAEHNKEHESELMKWAQKAEEMGLTDVAVNIRKAADDLDRSSKHLSNALKELGK